MKPFEEMTDDELRSYISSGKPSEPQKPFEEMTDDELRSYISGPQTTKQARASAPKILNEAADISAFDRGFVKNFGGDENEQAKWLQQKYPDMEIKVLGGDVVARKTGEEFFKKLDPSGWANLNPIEALKDLGDSAYDIGAGVASTAAGAGAGLATAPSVVGALPAAALASGVTSSAAEALRQKIGQYFGAKQDVSGADVALSGVLGGLGPLLLGTGASAKQIAKQAATPGTVQRLLGKTGGTVAESGATKEQVASAIKNLEKSQQGILGRASDASLSYLSGAAPKETLETAVKDVDPAFVKKLADAGLDIDTSLPFTNQELAIALNKQGKVEGFGDLAANTIYESIEKKQIELGKQITQGLQQTETKFDIASLKNPLESIIESTKGSKVEAVRAQAEAAKKVLNRYFGAGFDATKYKNVYDAQGNIIPKKKLGGFTGQIFTEAGKPIERRAGRSGKGLLVSAEEAMNINNSLSGFIDYTKSPIALTKKSADERQLRNAVIEAKDKLQTQIYDALEQSGKPELRKLYKENRDFFRNIVPKFSSPEKAVQTLQNINSPSNVILKERLKKLDEKYIGMDPKSKTNMAALAELADVAKYFGDPSLEAVSRGGATSTGKILRAGELAGTMAWAGGLASNIPGAAPIAQQAGRIVGQTFTSPKAVGAYLQSKTAARRAAEEMGVADFIRNISAAKGALPELLQPAISPIGAYQTGLMGEAAKLGIQLPASAWQYMTQGE